MNFEECMADNPPRMVVQYRNNHNGIGEFQWGIVGQMPVLDLIGSITQGQANLYDGEWIPEIEDHPAFVVAYHPDARAFHHYLSRDIPVDALVGMLEVIKQLLVSTRMAQHAGANQAPILGPDGRPVR